MDRATLLTVLQAILTGLTAGCIYALVAVGFTLIFGVMRLVNFAHGQLVMVAMYVSYVLFVRLGLDPFLSLPLTIPLLFVAGLLIFRGLMLSLLDQPDAPQMIVTLGLLILLENAALFLFGGQIRGITSSYTTTSFSLGAATVSLPRMAAAIVALVAIGSLSVMLRATKFGKAIRACADDKEGAVLVGIDAIRISWFTFAISCALAALAGSVITPFSTITPFVGFDFVLKAFVIVVVGGLGSLGGALIGGLIVGVVEALGLAFLRTSTGNALIFAILVIVMLFKPTGLFGRRR